MTLMPLRSIANAEPAPGGGAVDGCGRADPPLVGAAGLSVVMTCLLLFR
jgi:hypothetical protein